MRLVETDPYYNKSGCDFMTLKTIKNYFHLCDLAIHYKINRGYCPICEKETYFVQFSEWLRDYYKCFYCDSIPRQRALISTLNLFVPGWKNLVIHESSSWGSASEYIKRNCPQYTHSFFYPDITLGTNYNGNRCENLERMTFPDNSFDLFITQDVMEHVNNPMKAFKEISRVLKPNGIYLFTVPIYQNLSQSSPRIIESEDGQIQTIKEPIYHGNPIDCKGSIVTYDYGLDISQLIFKWSGLFTMIYVCRDEKLGIDGEFLDVCISKK
jgi:SAM-dependent methyltransferase